MQPSEVIAAVRTYGEPELVAVIDGLCGCGALLEAPADVLLRLAEFVAKSLEARNEKDAMKAAIKAADATADAAEMEALKSGQWP